MLKFATGWLIAAALLVASGPAVPQVVRPAATVASEPAGTIYPNAVVAQPHLAMSATGQSQYVKASLLKIAPTTARAEEAARNARENR